MTDNEKAATFIGWRPCELCETHQHFAMHDAAPDMRDPRNYTKALETARAKGDLVLELRNGVSITFGGGSLDFNYDGPCCDSIECAAVHFLAALYDAEASK